MPKEIMHVNIENPVEQRREVLSSVIDSIQMLKNYERYKQMQQEKDIYRKEFRNIIKELNIIMKELQDKLPVIEEEIKHKVAVKKTVPQKQQKVVEEAPKHIVVKKVDKFEEEMKLLREKIKKL